MSWRTLTISNPAKLSLKQRALCIQQDEQFRVPLEDIQTVILESPEIRISSALLAAIAEYNILLISCDNKHTPNGVLLSFAQHSRHSLVARRQVNVSKPFKKRLWQQIVRQKIINQAYCLSGFGVAAAEKLMLIADRVISGDTNNREAYAAKIYFKALFGSDFIRGQDDFINASLNYGYSIVRAFIARAIVGYGFIPAFGRGGVGERA